MCGTLNGWSVVLTIGLSGCFAVEVAEAAKLTSAPASTQSAKSGSKADDSFARLVPRDVRAFAELRGLSRIGGKLLPEGGLAEWTELAAGQTSRPAVTVQWGERLSRILGMSLDQATKDLFGLHVALAAPSYDELAEGVVLARAPNVKTISKLIAKNKAKQQPPVGKVKCYLLKEGVSLAVHDTYLVLGPRGRKTKLFERTAAMLVGGGKDRLSDLPRFGKQVRQLPAGRSGLLYLDLSESKLEPSGGRPEATDQPKRPQAFWSQLQRAVIGLYERGQGFDIEIRGQLDQPVIRAGMKDVSLEPIARLPESTLLVWARTIDVAGTYRRVMAGKGPEGRALRFNLEVVKALIQPVDLEEDVLTELGPQVMVVGGQVPADELGGKGDYAFPLVSVMVESRDVESSSAMLLRLVERFLGWIKVRFARAKQELDLDLVPTTYRGTTIYRISLGSLFSRTSQCPYLDQVEMCWSGVGDWLVISSHAEHVRQIIDAQRGPKSETFSATPAFDAIKGRAGVSDLVLVRADEMARALQTWIDYCAKHAPHVFKPLWWKRMMVRRSGRRVALGIIIKEGAEPGRVVVGNPVLPEMPAAGRLRPGDKICAVDGVTLSEDQPEDDLRDFLAMRKGGEVVLRVQRAGKLLDVRIPLPPPPPLPITADIDPIRSMRHLVKLGRGHPVGGYLKMHAKANALSATLLLRTDQTKAK